MPNLSELPVIILGAGGHARVLLAILRAEGAAIAGCTALERPDDRAWPQDVPYLGGIEVLDGMDPAKCMLVNGIGSAGRVSARRKVFERACDAGFRFRGLRHPSAIVDPAARVDPTALIMAGAIIQCGARIGANVIVNTGAIVDHDSIVGDHSHVATGARLAGEVTLGTAVHVGAGATIIQRGRLGDEAVVAAGAVVIRPVEPGATYGGVPAKPLVSRSS